MALRNTSERYEYIYGSNVRKLETDTAGKQTAKTVPEKKNLNKGERGTKQQIQKRRQLFRRMRRSFLRLTGSIRW